VPDVILPTLDEAAALPRLLSRMPEGFRPIVVDNGSTDGSADVAHRYGATVVVEPVRGFGAACWAGVLAASADVVCFMDADGSLDPHDLPRVSEAVTARRADLVLGARVADPGAWPLHARVANRFLAFEIRRRTGLELTDLGPKDRRSGWPLEMVLLAARAGCAVVEVPVPYRIRAGRSKVTGTVRGTARAVRDMAAALS
jgi:glycosyltransferase involved in cell wall biosynthesis